MSAGPSLGAQTAQNLNSLLIEIASPKAERISGFLSLRAIGK
jgi:hypothetical protein